MCLATGEAGARNSHEALRFQHSPGRFLAQSSDQLVGVTSSNSVVRGHSGPTQQHHTGPGCAGSGCAPLFATRWKQPQAAWVSLSLLP